MTDVNLLPDALRADPDEYALLGALLIDPSLVASTRLVPSDFRLEDTRETFGAMRAIVDRGDLPILTTLMRELKARGEKVKASTIILWANECPTTIHAPHYARNIAQASQRRRLLSASGNVAALAADPALSSDKAVTVASDLVADVRTRGESAAEVARMADSGRSFDERKAAARSGSGGAIATGYDDLDGHLSGGVRPNQLTIIGGRPGMGKSAMLRQMARAMASLGGTILYASNEMGTAELFDRDIADVSNVPLTTITTARWSEQDGDDIEMARLTLEFMPLVTYADGGMTSDRLRAEAERLHAREPIAAIVVDYLQRMADGGKSDLERVSKTARALKSLAMDLRVPVIAGSQLSRTQERDNPDTRPTLIDLRNSGEIEQEADIALLLYRAGYYYANEQVWNKAHRTERWPGNETEVIIAKQRQGVSGVTVRLLWAPQVACFRSLAR